MANRQCICRFCFEKCDTNFKAIIECTQDILNILRVTVNLAISDKPIMCKKCSEILQISFAFKKICLSIQDNTVAFEYAEKKDQAVCRFCMNLSEDHSFTIFDIEDISEKTTFETYFPELMDLSAIKKPVICDDCHESLMTFLSFTTMISIVEEKIKEYCKEKGVHSTDSIKLNDVLQFISENIWKENDNKLEVFEIEDMVSVESGKKKMIIEEGTCILCMKNHENFKAIDENTKNILEVILPKIDFTGEQELVMCEHCEEMLIKCYDFKATCLHNHNYMVPFFNNTNDVKVNLKDVYLSKNVTCTGVPEDKHICAFCMSLVNNSTAISLDVEEAAIMLERMIKQCLPELDLSIIMKPIICTSCYGSLQNCFLFVMNRLIIREQIKKNWGTNGESQIELSSSLQFTRSMKWEVDGNSTDVIKVEDQFCEDSEIFEREIGGGQNTVKLEQTFLDDSEDTNKDSENKYDSFIEINDHEVNSEQKYTPTNMLAHVDEGNRFGSIKVEDIVCGENETTLKEENSAEMEDQKFLLNEEIEIKTDEHEFNRFEDDIVLPQSEVSERLHRREKCFLERDQSKSDIKHSLTRKQISKIKMCQCELCAFQTNHKMSRVNHNLILEGFKKRLLAHKDMSEVTMHNCDSCSFQTSRKYDLKRHLLIHKDPSEVTMYKCDFCSFQTTLKKSLKTHLLEHKDPEVTMYTCYSCSFQTKFKCSLKKHLLKHMDPSEVTMYKCDFCSFQTKFKDYIKTHLLTHKDPSEVTMYKCNFCSFQTKLKRSLKPHLLTHKDPSEVTMYKCNVCTFQSKFKRRLKYHLLMHMDPSEVTMYKCDFCSFQTKFKHSLKTHLLTHKDPSEVTMYKCNFCSFQTKTKYYLKSHLLKHKDPSEVTMYKCNFCSFETKFKNSLNSHLLTHKDPSEVTMYKCNFCSYQTKIKRGLTYHLLQHKDPSEVTMYKCDFCSYQTKVKSHFTHHLLQHKDPSEVTMYKCNFCSFETKFKNSLNYHLLMHKDPSEVTMYKCDFCSYQTKFKGRLKNHLLTHKDPSEVTMYKCNFCPFQTKTKNSLKRHLLKHKDPQN